MPEGLSLAGVCIAVTRPRAQAEELAVPLEALGASVRRFPLLEIVDPTDWAPVDRSLQSLSQYDWLIFTSANGAQRLLARLGALGRTSAELDQLAIATVGSGTAAYLHSCGLQLTFVPGEFRSEALADGLADHVRDKRILLVRPEQGRDVLVRRLGQIAEVTEIVVYRSVPVTQPDPNILGEMRRGDIAYTTVTSSRIARTLAAVLDTKCRAHIAAGRHRLVSISPVTTATLLEEGLQPAGEADEYTSAGIVRKVVELQRAS